MFIFFIGMPGSGKSYWASKLAQEMDAYFIDLDMLITERSGKSIEELFAESENRFREEERDALLWTIQRYGSQQELFLIATGGGTPCFFSNLKWMKQHGKVVFLNTDLKTISHRLQQAQIQRPLLKNSNLMIDEKVNQLYEERKKYYYGADYFISDSQFNLNDLKSLILTIYKNHLKHV